MFPTDWLLQSLTDVPGSILVGVLALLGVRWTLSGEFKMQRDDWEQRDRLSRSRQQEQEKRQFTGALRALTI
jgi:hypothetical protein